MINAEISERTLTFFVVVSRVVGIMVSSNNDKIAVANAGIVNAIVCLFEAPPREFFQCDLGLETSEPCILESWGFDSQ